MQKPLVSVCVPNLNTRPYLEERVETILSQTYENWEMVISDNFSNDGAWEYFQEVAQRDSRVLINQAPRQGLYANWNNCIRRAKGEYIYIATSDDTMAPDCLEKMVAALEAHRECDLAHCKLAMIDGGGKWLGEDRWLECTVFAGEDRNLINRKHIRSAPYDGLLHLSRRIVYTSITELLIRRSLFSRTGLFETRWGSVGDFNWEMRASLIASTVHVPDTWASYRVHPIQATASVQFDSPKWFNQVTEMIEDALTRCEADLSTVVADGLRDDWRSRTRAMFAYYNQLRDRDRRNSVVKRRLFQLSRLLAGTSIERAELMYRLQGKAHWPVRFPGEIRGWLESLGFEPIIVLQ